MIAAARHPQEEARLAELRRLGILDTPPDPDFDALVALAAEIAGTPIALVSLIDSERQWFKASHGLADRETPRDLAFCAHAILEPDRPFVVEDARDDRRFHDNPLVTGGPRVVFYAGMPLRSAGEGLPLGTLCVIDHQPRALPPERIAALRTIARQVELLLALRRHTRVLGDALLESDALRRELEQARDQAVAAIEAKRLFLAAMGHDLRTPMHGVIGMAELALESPSLGGEVRTHVEGIIESASSLVRLVDDIIDQARIEGGSLVLENVPFRPADELRRCLAPLRVLAERKGLTLDLAVAQDWATGDPLRFRQIAVNLVGNAIKFTASGSVRVDLEHPGVWRLSVADTGIGMDEAAQRRLFTPFAQAEPGTARRFGGSGLGLSIVRGLAEAMGGSVAVASRPGRGTTMTVELPLAAAAGPARRGPRLGLRVLIADDEAVGRQIAGAVLTSLGCESELAVDGEEAVRRWREARAAGKPYDALLLDRRMPGRDGDAVAAAIRATEGAGGRCRIVAVSADSGAEEREAWMAAGADAVLAKPYLPEELAAALLG